MSPRKKVYESRVHQQQAYVNRLKEAGRRRVCVWMGEEAAERLKRMAEEQGRSQGELLEALLLERSE